MLRTTGDFVVLSTVRPVRDTTPPEVAITSPDPLQCVCNPVSIFGTAEDPEGFDSYTLEYAANPSGPWTLIATSTTPVSGGLLGVWNTTALAQGYYFIRLTATNTAGLSSSITTIVYVDKQFDTVDLRSPPDGAILGGIVCFDGTVNDGNGNCSIKYTIEYRPAGGGAFQPVDPANPTYNGAVINDPLGSWNTLAGGVPDGDYEVRVTGVDGCGHTKSVTHKVIIDNTVPVAVITKPAPCVCVDGQVTVVGTASDAHLAGWVLQYTGGDAAGWVTIASGHANVFNGVLGVWDTTGLRPCAYTLRLLVSDAAGVNCSGYTHQSEYLVSVTVGDCDAADADFDNDGDVDLNDFSTFQACFNGPNRPPACP